MAPIGYIVPALILFALTVNAEIKTQAALDKTRNVQVDLENSGTSQRRRPGTRGFLFGNWWPWENQNPAPAPAPQPQSSSGVDLTLPPMSCSIKRFDDIFFSGTLVGVAKNIQSAELCVAVCWQFRKQGRICGSVNYRPSSLTCELRDGALADSSAGQSSSDSIHMIPLNCEETGSSGGPAPAPAPSTAKCGQTFNKPSIDLTPQARSKARIVGGTEATANSYPWIVSLQQGFWSTNHFCGGTLIRVSDTVDESDIIITASHCLAENPSSLKVVLGAHDLKASTAGKITVAAAKWQMHQQYDHETTVNDIAIVKLEKPVKFSDKIQPACLPQQGEPVRSGESAIVAGWGTLQEGKVKLPGRLMQVPVPVVPDSSCLKYYAGEVDLRLMFCAGYDRGGKDSCQGDSGGPLIFRTTTGYILRGVVSFGEGCARAGKPGVYTKVSNYRNWINETARRLTSVRLQ